MKDRKRRFELYAIWDHTGLEAHMARMAEKGWLIEKIDNLGWVYRRIEPKKLTFCVCYYPKASDFAPGPDEAQETFYEFCQYAGWELAASWAQLQIFYNERENPIPIDTDPVMELESIHKTVRRTTLLSHALFILIALMEVGIAISQYRQDPIGTLSNVSWFVSAICWALVLLLAAGEFTAYYRWRTKAKKAAERGEFLATNSRVTLQTVCLIVLGFVVLYYFLSIFSSGNRMMMAIAPLMFLGLGLAIVLVNLLKKVLKRRKISARANMALTLAAAFVLSFSLVGGITFGMLRLQQNGWFNRDRDTVRDELPLKMEDLLDLEYTDAYDQDTYVISSPFLAQYKVRLYPVEYAKYPDLPWLSYTIGQIKVPALYDFCKNTLLTEYENDEYWQNRTYIPQDAAPWGAEDAYRLYDEEFGYWDRYLLCYPDRIVELSPDWELTPEQMATVGERLGGN